MRKLIVCNLVSLDGYYEGPGKDVMPLFDYRRDRLTSADRHTHLEWFRACPCAV
jgi:hypothetical protein